MDPELVREQDQRAGASARTIEYVDETPKRGRRTAHLIKAETALGHHFVSMIALEKPAPRFFGDNRGMWPISVEANADWRVSGVVFDRNQPASRAIRLVVVGVRSKSHGQALKSALDESLNGREAVTLGDPLRHRFRNGVDFGDFEHWWGPLMHDALMQCEVACRGFDVFTRAEHEQMVRDHARAAMEKRGRV